MLHKDVSLQHNMYITHYICIVFDRIVICSEVFLSRNTPVFYDSHADFSHIGKQIHKSNTRIMWQSYYIADIEKTLSLHSLRRIKSQHPDTVLQYISAQYQ